MLSRQGTWAISTGGAGSCVRVGHVVGSKAGGGTWGNFEGWLCGVRSPVRLCVAGRVQGKGVEQDIKVGHMGSFWISISNAILLPGSCLGY